MEDEKTYTRSLDETEKLRRSVSELEEQNHELRDRKTIYLTVLEVTDETVVIKGAEGRYNVVNSVLARRLGRSREGLIGKKSPTESSVWS